MDGKRERGRGGEMVRKGGEEGQQTDKSRETAKAGECKTERKHEEVHKEPSEFKRE